MTDQQQKEWLKDRISTCREANQELVNFNKWATELYEKVQVISSFQAQSSNEEHYAE